MLRWAPLLLLGIALLVLFNVHTLHDSGGVTAAASAAPATQSLTRAANPPAPAAPSRAAPPAGSCAAANATELAGVVVRWGDGHVQRSWQECCAACEAHSGGVPAPGAPACNVWVYCPHDVPACAARAGQCWLKRQALFEGVAAGVMATGAGVPWVSGSLPRFDPPPDADALGVAMRALVPSEARAWPPPRRRECGSPAVDGYSHVEPSCLERSATATQFDAAEAARMALVVWAEEGASYDGLAVAWGIGNKKPTAAACADACRRHVPDPPNGPARLGGQFGASPLATVAFASSLAMTPRAARTHLAEILTRALRTSWEQVNCRATLSCGALWAARGALSLTRTRTRAATAGSSSPRCQSSRR